MNNPDLTYITLINKTMEKKITAIIERATDGSYSIYTLEDFDGFMLAGYGETPDAAIADFWDVHKELKEELGADIVPDIDVTFRYDVASFLRKFKEEFSMSGLQAITGINQKQLHHYLSGQSRPSASTVQKIQAGIADFAKELSAIQFA